MGVIIICLTVRAIHIEIANSLSTDSFLKCLRNFIARSGSPAEIFSDNGTNFRGADRFLREELENINFNEVHKSFRSSLMEVEMIVNSRPLTYVSIDYADQEPITPKHFILGSSNGSKPFCELDNIDYRMRLRQSEIIANAFWRRWVKEMLATFTRRSKWSQNVKPIEVDDVVLIVYENSKRNI
ncbi:hypothetical protein CVS40_6377 [Lucilia cuprina]|nr:hypothetical protein CVS40_6377 [Lucilia cuprina]